MYLACFSWMKVLLKRCRNVKLPWVYYCSLESCFFMELISIYWVGLVFFFILNDPLISWEPYDRCNKDNKKQSWALVLLNVILKNGDSCCAAYSSG